MLPCCCCNHLRGALRVYTGGRRSRTAGWCGDEESKPLSPVSLTRKGSGAARQLATKMKHSPRASPLSVRGAANEPRRGPRARQKR